MKTLSKLGLLFLISCRILLGQTFDKTVLVDTPGDNFDFDFVSPDFFEMRESYVVWVNKFDSLYTIYMKKIFLPTSDENIVIASGTEVKSNPQIAYNCDYSGIKIVWESYSNNFFQIVGRDYLDETLTDEIVIEDSLNENPQISLSSCRLVWLDAGKLYVKDFLAESDEPVLIDSETCVSPQISKNDYSSYSRLIYVRNETESKKIIFSEYNDVPGKGWSENVIAEGENSNPDIGPGGGISFETFENGIFKIKYSAFGTEQFCLTENVACNYNNPTVFSYPVPTNNVASDETPFFVAFEADSLEGNREIFINTFYFGAYESLINVSNTAGDDFLPKVGLVTLDDTVYVVIVWLHRENDKTDIWMAKTVFDPIINDVEETGAKPENFVLEQNYPNPFNPVTTIKYAIPKIGGVETHGRVSLRIYNILGEEIKTLVNQRQSPGNYTVQFDASDLAGGVYFYTLRVGDFIATKKMILLK